MQYIAMEWDHQSHHTTIKWLVMICAGTEIHAGAIQAVKPRRDIAYFVDKNSAVATSKIFADLKNDKEPEEKLETDPNTEYVAYPWDHLADSNIIKWAVLHWNKKNIGIRVDIAYFLDGETAKDDANSLADYLNAKMQVT
jgi:hypothetical protein